MKKNKAFTLVELMGILLVLSLILLIAVPAISNTLRKSEQKQYDEFLNDLNLATETYIELNRNHYPELNQIGGQAYISLHELVTTGLVKKTVQNPKTKEDIPLDHTVTVTMQANGMLSYEYVEANLNLDQYAKDGLLLWYDAINHGNDANVWADLSGNNRNGTLTNVVFSNQTAYFNGTDSGVYLGDLLTDLYNGSNTVEILVSFDENNARDILMGNFAFAHNVNIERHVNNRGRFYFDNGGSDLYTVNDYYVMNTVYGTSQTFHKGEAISNLYKNGVNMQNYTSNLYSTFSYPYTNVWIGRDSRTGTTVLKGKIYAVRIYNRVLTEQEIKNNYTLDQLRYHLK